MCKQVLIDNQWYDVSYIQQDGPTDRFVIVYQDNGSPRTTSLSSGWLRDKPVDKPIDTVDWTKPLQIKCGGGLHWEEVWADVVFHKRYGDVIALIFEKEGEPIYITENIKDFNLTVRNAPTKVTYERWLVYINNDLHQVYGDEDNAKERLNYKLQTNGNSGYIKHIKVEWEV